MDDREQSVQHFLDLIKRSQRGKFKVYIGMIAGVGKSHALSGQGMTYKSKTIQQTTIIYQIQSKNEKSNHDSCPRYGHRNCQRAGEQDR